MDSAKLIHRLTKVAYAVAGIFLLILGLRFIVAGARGMEVLFDPQRLGSFPSALGFGWLMACIVLSGSPVAATSLALHAGEAPVLNTYETFAMINGSRLGAAFVVLLIGFIYDVRGRRHHTKSIYVGAIALLTTLTTYLPAMLLGYGLLRLGWLTDLRPGWVWGVVDVLDRIYDPMVGPVKAFLHPHEWALAILGVLDLLLAFKVFDLALPQGDPFHGRVARMATVVYRPIYTLLLGMLVTCLTLSVSVSISILVPLTAKGYVRRENLIPYIMGANLTTWVDTLFLSLTLKSPDAFEIVLVEMLAGTLITLPVIFFAYAPFERIIDRLATAVTLTKKRLAVFVAFFLAIPLVLMVL